MLSFAVFFFDIRFNIFAALFEFKLLLRVRLITLPNTKEIQEQFHAFWGDLRSLNTNLKLVFCIRLEISEKLFFCYCDNIALDANCALYCKRKLELHHLENQNEHYRRIVPLIVTK